LVFVNTVAASQPVIEATGLRAQATVEVYDDVFGIASVEVFDQFSGYTRVLIPPGPTQ